MSANVGPVRQRCPTCGQPIGTHGPVRVCSICSKPILKRHKFRIVGSLIQHKVCEDPCAYTKGKHGQ